MTATNDPSEFFGDLEVAVIKKNRSNVKASKTYHAVLDNNGANPRSGFSLRCVTRA